MVCRSSILGCQFSGGAGLSFNLGGNFSDGFNFWVVIWWLVGDLSFNWVDLGLGGGCVGC